MAYKASLIANEFIRKSLASGETKCAVTNMKLQKLVYIAHGYFLAIFGEPLIENDIHAFEWGPVIPVLYKDLKAYKANTVDQLIPVEKNSYLADGSARLIVDKVWDAYGKFSAADLSRITHMPETPWSEIWGTNKYAVIPNDLIREHYSDLLNVRQDIKAQ